jgi:hypothetical protein
MNPIVSPESEHADSPKASSTSSENELEISADSDSQQNADAESPEIWGESELEILKELVRSIEKNLNQGEALPQKAVSFNGKTNTEKIFNLTEEAVRRFNDSQEMPPRALKILNKTTEQGHKGFDLLNCFQAIARITQNDAIEMNRRAMSTNRAGVDKLKNEMYNEVQPRIFGLAKEVFESEVFSSDRICNWARIMEPSETENLPKTDLKELEQDIEWILTRLWGKAAGSL